MPNTLCNWLEAHTAPAATALREPEADGAIRCKACGHRCLIRPGKTGVCKMRVNRGGELRVPDGYIAGLAADPIEKKPFFHVLPGSLALSFGMLGCNLHCAFCQNWTSSQTLRDPGAGGRPELISAEEISQAARQVNAPVIVSTYNEPLITADWAAKIFAHAREQGLHCGFVSNGLATPEVLDFLRPYVDLYKVDLKSFQDAEYRRLGGRLNIVLDTIQRLHAMGFWVEVVTLVVPGFNDSPEELRGIATFLAGVSQDIPWHVTAFHPAYRMLTPQRTTPDTLTRAWDAGKTAGLRHVYTGNTPGKTEGREDTWCPECNTRLIARHGFTVLENRLQNGHCPECGAAIAGVWK